MKHQKFVFVANWKMNLTSHTAVQLCKENKKILDSVATNDKATIVLCPPFTALTSLADIFKDSAISLGAQNCSTHNPGAYTGEVSAQDLAEIGCTYTIIGHSEPRRLLHETDADIAIKTEQLLSHNIVPIICIGETQEHYDKKTTNEELWKQLKFIFNIAKRYSNRKIYIAYEPVWAIGTNVTPDTEHLQKIFNWLQTACDDNNGSETNRFLLLYGGSVNEESISTLRTVAGIDGFLIGSASLDFQKFEKIVSLAYI